MTAADPVSCVRGNFYLSHTSPSSPRIKWGNSVNQHIPATSTQPLKNRRILRKLLAQPLPYGESRDARDTLHSTAHAFSIPPPGHASPFHARALAVRPYDMIIHERNERYRIHRSCLLKLLSHPHNPLLHGLLLMYNRSHRISW